MTIEEQVAELRARAEKAEAERDEAVRQRNELLDADVAREGAERQAVRLIATVERLQEQLVGAIARAEKAEKWVRELDAQLQAAPEPATEVPVSAGIYCDVLYCSAMAMHHFCGRHFPRAQAAPEPPATMRPPALEECAMDGCYLPTGSADGFCPEHMPPADDPITQRGQAAVEELTRVAVRCALESVWNKIDWSDPAFEPLPPAEATVTRAEVVSIADARIADAMEQLIALMRADCREWTVRRDLVDVVKRLREDALGGGDRG